MANKELKWPDQVPGTFYVDECCINCVECRRIAPEFFKGDEWDDHVIVYKQPTEPQDVAVCLEAMDACPVWAIGDDGEGSALREVESVD